MNQKPRFMLEPRNIKANFILPFLAGCVLTAWLLTEIQKPEQVETIQEKERVVTKIEERPDGSKTTIIVSNKDKTQSKQSSKPKDWILSTSVSLDRKPDYGISVSRRILGDLYLGADLTTKHEFWFRISYNF